VVENAQNEEERVRDAEISIEIKDQLDSSSESSEGSSSSSSQSEDRKQPPK